MNKVILIGRLCADPETRYSEKGDCVAKYRLAVNRKFKKEGQPEADFLNCIAFGKTGEFASRFLKKGSKIAIEGRVQTGSYEKDGVKHYTTDIIVEQHEFCDSNVSFNTAPAMAPAPAAGMATDYPVSDDDDRLPF